MKHDSPSQTAMATAFLRALHLAVDEAPYVFEDRAAAAFLPASQQRYLKRLATLAVTWRVAFRQRRNAVAGMRSQVLVRARYAEDALAAARTRGCRRYLILAAGLDTFAQRQATLSAPFPVIEIDHPATQTWKRHWLEAHDLSDMPATLYLPVDFEHTTLQDALSPAVAPQFISWLGTTYYLTRDAIAGTLNTLARQSPAGSELVLDYWRETRTPDLSGALLWGTRVATALQQEPMRSFFEPGEMERLAQAAGWQVREHCAPVIQNQRFLNGRSDGLQVPGFAFMLHLERP